MKSDKLAHGPDHERMSALLLYYELGGLSRRDRAAFEAHTLECDTCFAELEHGAAVFGALREHKADALRALAPAASPLGERRRASFWVPHFRFAAPAFAALLLVTVGILLHDTRERPNVRDLAEFPREKLPVSTLRAPAMRDAADELMASGASYYELGNYAEAARRFEAALARSPGRADAAYYLGLARALAGDLPAAVGALERAEALAQGELQARAAWALANAYLASDRKGDASRVLEELAAGQGAYAGRAREKLARLPR